jgi:hypothetical protein
VRSWRAIGVCVAAAILAWPAPAVAGTSWDERSAPEKVRVLDVPYVPQSSELCGGAALAMVLRYWGKPGVRAEDFAALVEPGRAGIPTDTLVKAVEASGWTAVALPGTPAEVASQLARGRPVIALIRAGPDSFHYVVILAWANGGVIIHDPGVGPFRTIREGGFDTAWSASGRWALLVLPPQKAGGQRKADPPVATPPSPSTPDPTPAVTPASPAAPDSAAAPYPSPAAPLRERAWACFRAGDWSGASRLAVQALALDPNDADTWRLLAGSRFLDGDVDGALDAWNHLSEPRNDLTRIDGLARIRFSAVAGQLNLPPGRILTPQAYRRARRRLAEIPAQSEFRLSLRPLPAGRAQVNVALLERPLVFTGRWDVASTGARAVTDREVSLDVASPTGNGELWTAGWRWWKDRPRASLTLAVPAAGGRPGIWRLDGFWERQAYEALPASDSNGPTRTEVRREERRRTAVSYADWFGPDLRLEAGAALDEWSGRGDHLSLDGSVETRWARDRLALRADAARWMSLRRGAPFGAGSLSLKWSSSGLERCDAWQGGIGLSGTTAAAPLALWSGAGTGTGRAPLLRAHPLLNGGIIRGRVFGRALLHGTIERQVWPWKLGPLQLGWAAFVDGARAWETGWAGRVPWQVDGGAGLRVRSLGLKGQLRIDAGHGFRDGSSAVSVGWQVP